MRRIKKRYGNSIYWIAALSGCLIFSTAMLFGVLFAIKSYTSAKQELENGYKKALFEITDSVNDIELNLSKMMVSANEELNVEIAEKIRLQSQTAQDYLSQLPITPEAIYDVNKFLNQVGDWCASYCRTILVDGEVSIFEEKIEEIYFTAKNLNNELKELSNEFLDGKASINTGLTIKGIRDTNGTSLFAKRNAIEFPELVYDGPFSDLEGERCFKALENLPVISQEEALEKATKILEGRGLKNVRYFAKTTLPDSYDFIGNVDGGTVYFSVSQNGGKLISINTDLVSTGEKIDIERAKELAVSYAENCDYCRNLQPVWCNNVDGVAYINLAPVVDGIVHYPDLVKVKIGLDDGKLIAMEAMGFCTNNCVRELTASLDQNTAKSLISPKLSIHACRLALIPLHQVERLCYELVCEYSDLNYLVYIDANSGKQVSIMRVVDGNQGQIVL